METVYAIVTLSFGILITGLVMLKGIFNRITAYLGLATGITGIATLAGFFPIAIMNALFAMVWVLFAGYRLYRLGQQ
jgi:predicted Abi (CAAX) family protease